MAKLTFKDPDDAHSALLNLIETVRIITRDARPESGRDTAVVFLLGLMGDVAGFLEPRQAKEDRAHD